MKLQLEIKKTVEDLRAKGVTGELRVVPVCFNKRCFVPCDVGRCNCRSNLDIENGYWVIVKEDARQQAISDFNSTIKYIERDINEAD